MTSKNLHVPVLYRPGTYMYIASMRKLRPQTKIKSKGKMALISWAVPEKITVREKPNF